VPQRPQPILTLADLSRIQVRAEVDEGDARFLKAGQTGSDSLKAALQQHVKSKLAPHKYPRWIEFRSELPKTATGKIQRFKLRS